MVEKRETIRCAVYTRKSTEDGLDQAFNSLDAQYEACAAYILSQKHEGWTQTAERYDDGGFSGGSMQRPGLQRLLAEVEAGRVDVIVVYKVDRLTRSLADFAKIVDILDARKASFVSITQAFNTTTSMGRLTLNVLLSFAQFEREVTGERIRDKIAASKRKGLWMGGPVPLGYEVRDRKLVVHDAEAETVRHIMRRYLALGSVRELVDELGREGRVTKVQHRTSGPHRGGIPFARGAIFHLLQNRIYRGEIVHKGTAHPGDHDPIVPVDLWDAVQAKLAKRGCGPSERLPVQHPSMFVGCIVDGANRPMTPTHAAKGTKRYRYYVTRPDALSEGGQPAWRVAASDLERLVVQRIEALLVDRSAIYDLVLATGIDIAMLDRILRQGAVMTAKLVDGAASDKRATVQPLVAQIALHEHHLDIAIDPIQLLAALGVKPDTPAATEPLIISCQTARVRKGHELRLVIPSRVVTMPTPAARDQKLVSLLAEARIARKLILAAPERSLASVAAATGRCRSRLGKLVALSCLAPDIVTMIVEGRQPAELTASRLTAATLPLEWREQHIALGIA